MGRPGHRVRWTLLALSDLRSARDYVAADNLSTAKALLRQIRSAVARLATLPALGRLVPERTAQGYREIIVAPYRVIYGVTGREVHILRVWHSRRNPDEML